MDGLGHVWGMQVVVVRNILHYYYHITKTKGIKITSEILSTPPKGTSSECKSWSQYWDGVSSSRWFDSKWRRTVTNWWSLDQQKYRLQFNQFVIINAFLSLCTLSPCTKDFFINLFTHYIYCSCGLVELERLPQCTMILLYGMFEPLCNIVLDLLSDNDLPESWESWAVPLAWFWKCWADLSPGISWRLCRWELSDPW